MDIREKAGRAIAAYFAPDRGREEMIEMTWRSHRRSSDVAFIAVAGEVEAMIADGDVGAWRAVVAAAKDRQEEIRLGGLKALEDVKAGLYDPEVVYGGVATIEGDID